MLNWFENNSIKIRLSALIMLVSGLAVVFAACIISVIGYFNLKENLFEKLENSAQIIGQRNMTVLAFHDFDGAQNNLQQMLMLNNDMQAACLYDKNAVIFARYTKSKKGGFVCPEQQETGRVHEENEIYSVFKSISKSPELPADGWIYIESNFNELNEYIRRQLMIVGGVLLAVFAMAYGMTMSLQSTISSPILELAKVARRISRDKDYSLRATVSPSASTNNEIDTLIDAFNMMLTEIGNRERELLQSFDELRKARDHAETANRSKSHFLANISHELRTPLNAIIGFSSILQNQLFGELGNKKYVEYAKDIHDSGAHLLEIINDILDLSKAEAGKLKLSFEELDIQKAINKSMGLLANRASESGVILKTDIPSGLPPLMADRLRFNQVLINIISNAVKFTDPGGSVTVRVKTQPIATVGVEVEKFIVEIQDTGIGMHKDDIPRAFQSFGQVDSDLNRKYEGTGLGLPLTRKLMDLHHGRIEMDSQLGVGTTVRLYFWANPTRFVTLSSDDV